MKLKGGLIKRWREDCREKGENRERDQALVVKSGGGGDLRFGVCTLEPSHVVLNFRCCNSILGVFNSILYN